MRWGCQCRGSPTLRSIVVDVLPRSRLRKCFNIAHKLTTNVTGRLSNACQFLSNLTSLCMLIVLTPNSGFDLISMTMSSFMVANSICLSSSET